MQIKFTKITKSFPLKLLLIFAIFSLTACGGGGGDGGGGLNPAEGSTWDEMEWDQGTWG